MIARARSGTTVLTQMLNSHPSVYAYGEVLNADYGHNFFKFLANRIRKDRKLCRPELSGDLFLQFIDEMVRSQSHANAVVFDLKYECLHTVFRAWQPALNVPLVYELAKDNGYHVMHVTRRNHLRRLLSNQKAVETGNYHASKAEDVKVAKTGISTNMLLEKLCAFDAAYDQTSAFFAGYEHFLEFDYDDMFDESGFAQPLLTELAEFLEVPEEFDAVPRNVKVTQGRLQELISNYEEVAATLRGTQYERFLEG